MSENGALLVARFSLLASVLRVGLSVVLVLGLLLVAANRFWPAIVLVLGWAACVTIHAVALAVIIYAQAVRNGR